MAEQPQNKRRHFLLQGTSTPHAFTAHAPKGIAKPLVPDLPRQQHGQNLRRQLEDLKPIVASATAEQQEQGLESGLGLQIQFVSQPGIELAFQSLANESQKIELLSVRNEGDHTYANVFVPDGKLAHFEKYITEYLEEKKNKNEKPLDHRALLNTIESIRTAEVRALWTDDIELLPKNSSESFWWEVWLPVRGQRQAVVNDFKKMASLAECTVSEQQFEFPERTILLMYGSEQQLTRSVLTLNCVAELRRAKETAEFFDEMGVEEQREWLDEVLKRANFAHYGDRTPHICLLDSGVNRGHPLLEPLIAPNDMHSAKPAGRTDDTANHGTGMAGLAAYGDLTEALESNFSIEIGHRLESVRLVDGAGANPGSASLHASLFSDAVARPEIVSPYRQRIFCSAVTASDYRDRGRPSSWSSAVDSLAADADGAGAFPRLFILSAGNTNDVGAWSTYPASLSTNLIHDPGQAWNVLTVGACTYKSDTKDPGYKPVAEAGGLSPYTTTSSAWENTWPLKPDVVLEGGNLGANRFGPIGMSSLHLLSTHNQPLDRLFTTFNATSAASALCARMAAQISGAYPNLRPETIRALIVHSAEWSESMRTMYLPASRAPTKQDYTSLIRHCGWGAPDLERALWSASNSLTLVIEDLVHPYKKDQGKSPATRDMNLHALPWPREELEALQDAQVQMRVTLSYFVEPNPSARGAASKYHYPSHRLRFDVQRPLDSTEDFIARVNAAAQREDDGDQINPKDPHWYLGDRQRHRGSLHQDVWVGTAADLASRGYIAVYPSAGWWRTRPALERYNLPARYSLVVSIRTDETKVDLYNAIANQVAIVI